MKLENLRKAKDTAIILLEIPVRVRPLCLSGGKVLNQIDHPFFPSSGIIFAPEDNEQPFYSIMSSNAALQKAICQYKGFIEEAKSITAILLLINRPYRLQFLELIRNGLSPDETKELSELI